MREITEPLFSSAAQQADLLSVRSKIQNSQTSSALIQQSAVALSIHKLNIVPIDVSSCVQTTQKVFDCSHHAAKLRLPLNPQLHDSTRRSYSPAPRGLGFDTELHQMSHNPSLDLALGAPVIRLHIRYLLDVISLPFPALLNISMTYCLGPGVSRMWAPEPVEISNYSVQLYLSCSFC